MVNDNSYSRHVSRATFCIILILLIFRCASLVLLRFYFEAQICYFHLPNLSHICPLQRIHIY